MIALSEIRAAEQRLASAPIHRTPIMSAHTIADAAPAPIELVLKCELFQKTGSFKVRGAINKIATLSDAERARGLCTVSAGNHAAAVAWAARHFGAPCVVVMPTSAPKSKLAAVRAYGAEIVLHDDRPTLFDRLHQVEAERGLTFVHPFDDPAILAGAATVGLEIVADAGGPIDAVVVPVGGGGLLGGVVSAVKALSPHTRIIAVELEAGPGLGPALAAGKPVPAPRPATLADGMTPPFVGALPLAIAREAGVEIATVTEAEIITAMGLLMTRGKLYAEASGAAATAAILAGKVAVAAGARVVAIVSGGNVDPDRALAALGGLS